MRKKVFGRNFSRNRNSRKALFRSLIRSLLEYGKIVTTESKAKAIQKEVDKLVKLAKMDSLASVRKINSILGNDRESLNNLKLKVKNSFKNKKSGFTRTTLLPRRKGDAARMIRLEWSELMELGEEKTKKSVKSKKNNKDAKSTVKGAKDSKKKTLKDRLENIRKNK